MKNNNEPKRRKSLMRVVYDFGTDVRNNDAARYVAMIFSFVAILLEVFKMYTAGMNLYVIIIYSIMLFIPLVYIIDFYEQNDMMYFKDMFLYRLHLDPGAKKQKEKKRLELNLFFNSLAALISLILLDTDIPKSNYVDGNFIFITFIESFLMIAPLILLLNVVIIWSRYYALNVLIDKDREKDEAWNEVKKYVNKIYLEERTNYLKLDVEEDTEIFLKRLDNQIRCIPKIHLYDNKTKELIRIVIIKALIRDKEEAIKRLLETYNLQMKITKDKVEVVRVKE